MVQLWGLICPRLNSITLAVRFTSSWQKGLNTKAINTSSPHPSSLVSPLIPLYQHFDLQVTHSDRSRVYQLLFNWTEHPSAGTKAFNPISSIRNSWKLSSSHQRCRPSIPSPQICCERLATISPSSTKYPSHSPQKLVAPNSVPSTPQTTRLGPPTFA